MKFCSCIIILLASFVQSGYSQMCPCEFGGENSKTLRNELSINMLNYTEDLLNFTSQRPAYMFNYLNGLMYKRHLDKFSIRAGYDHHKNKYSYVAQFQEEYNKNTGENYSDVFRAGVEKTGFGKTVQVFLGADIIYGKSTYKGNTTGYGKTTPAYNMDYQFNVTTTGMSPFAGIRFRPFRRFSISLETSISILKFKTSETAAFKSHKSVALLFDPLRILSLNYHF